VPDTGAYLRIAGPDQAQSGEARLTLRSQDLPALTANATAGGGVFVLPSDPAEMDDPRMRDEIEGQKWALVKQGALPNTKPVAIASELPVEITAEDAARPEALAAGVAPETIIEPAFVSVKLCVPTARLDDFASNEETAR